VFEQLITREKEATAIKSAPGLDRIDVVAPSSAVPIGGPGDVVPGRD